MSLHVKSFEVFEIPGLKLEDMREAWEVGEGEKRGARRRGKRREKMRE